MPQATPTYNLDDTLKLIKWARKRGALLIKVNGVELTFPPDIDFREKIAEKDIDVIASHSMQHENAIGEQNLRKALSTDALNQIEDQEKWFNNNRPPQL